jgi:hypothetical protein
MYKQVHLCGGAVKFDLYVMDFVRFGMQNAQPRFRTPGNDGFQIMENIRHWSVIYPKREHDASWFKTIDHPDANLIAAAPDLLQACIEMVHELENTTSDKNPTVMNAKSVIHKALNLPQDAE